ncbi:MAG: DUF1997 domain-containing protein [Merismopedia sp. SIO2A8]|nr:DUF1997 domain-containing protein [Symploca sp. SIO2B6]NET48693.1 DUF1997 domain-containing protein [Merismopedia sp. SIO2A8]
MQANSADQLFGASSTFIQSGALTEKDVSKQSPDVSSAPTYFHGHFSNCMEMLAGISAVAEYLDAHQGWFCRCARPMTAEPLGDNGYALTIGRFGSFGYEVEPKIGLHLLPADEHGVYRIETIDIPGYEPPGYHVDFKASMQLVEAGTGVDAMTRVEWELDLAVHIHFPRFIHALPKSLVEGTGDRLLGQIVRQASKCLTHKVQDDFHATIGVPFPKHRRLALWKK